MKKKEGILRPLREMSGKGLLVLCLLTAILASVAVTASVFFGKENIFVALLIDKVAAVYLFAAVYTVVYKVKGKAVELIKKNKTGERFLNEYDFRTKVFSLFSTATSAFFTVYNGVVGILQNSSWFMVQAVYFGALTVMRCILLLLGNDEEPIKSKNEKKSVAFGMTGAVLVLSSVLLTLGVVRVVQEDVSVKIGYTPIYVTAFYTFIKIIFAVRNFFRATKSKDLVVQSLRNINFADALASVLSLQTAMLREFNQADPTFTDRLNTATGITICVLVFLLGLFMIIRSLRSLLRKKRN